MFKSIVAFLLFMTSTLFMGCSTTQTDGNAKGLTGISQPDSVSKANVLAPGDTIEVSVEVDGQTEIPPSSSVVNSLGYVTLPLVGDVMIGKLDVNLARSVITSKYAAYYVHPPVVMLRLAGSAETGEQGTVTLTGRVARQGPVQIKRAEGIRLTEAIQQAGGFAPDAKRSSIRITRRDKKGADHQFEVDYNDIGLKGNADADVLLKDGDIVYVPQRIW